MPKTSLGFTPRHMMDSPIETKAPEGKKEPKICYPSISIEGDAADAIIADHKPGDTFQALVTFKVVSHRAAVASSGRYSDYDDSGSQMELEAIEFADPGEPDGDEEMTDQGEESAEDAADKFMAEQGKE